MWARRIGVPPLWPSRIKVVILCLVILTFVYSFFAYLHDANVNYLELSAPKESGITCGRVPEKCWNDASPLACGIKEYSWGFTSLPIDKVLTSACPVEYLLQSCSNVSHPLSSLHTDLAKLHTLNRYTNPFGGWAYLYFIMMACLGVSIMAHDLCLLVEDLRPRIHSLRVVQADMPFVWSMSCGIQFLWPMGRLQEKAKPLWLLLWLPWACWRIVVFMFLIYPLYVALFLLTGRIVRLSRMMVFLSGLECMFASVIYVLSTIIIEATYNEVYALFWNAPNLAPNCVCYCQYPLRQATISRLVLLGLTVAIGSGSLAFRALKGLRRPNWANLFCVLYAVPIEAFPIMWERPKEAGGGPIQWRKIGEPVQGEPAFDPFCLMDEQPESGRTSVEIMPTVQSQSKMERWHKVRDSVDTDIGCCGIPSKLGAAKAEKEWAATSVAATETKENVATEESVEEEEFNSRLDSDPPAEVVLPEPEPFRLSDGCRGNRETSRDVGSARASL